MDVVYHGTSDRYSGQIPTTSTDVGQVLVLDQRFSNTTWVDLSTITGGPGGGGNPAGARLGMAVSGNLLTLNVLDVAGADKQINCAINNGHLLVASDCAMAWSTLPATP
ncbi:MAG TPA: hypothetical protein VFU73_01775 [Actinocrinis sp.]|nr:hypothetical protein [Actinocrinis sp.]